MTTYADFMTAVIKNWKTACDLNVSVTPSMKKRVLDIRTLVNYRTSKSAIYQSVMHDCPSITRKESDRLVDEGVVKGDIIPAYGHFRLGLDNIKAFLELYKKDVDSGINIDRLMLQTKKRTGKVPMGIYATVPTSPAPEKIEPTHVVAQPVSPPEKKEVKPIDKMTAFRRSLGGFTRLFDCMAKNGVNFTHVSDIDINDQQDLEITYADGTAVVIETAKLLHQWDEYNASAEKAEAKVTATKS